MKTALSLVAVATLLIAPNLSALQSAAPDPAVLPGIQASAGELSPDVQLYMGRGDELSSHLRYDAAAREYARAADVARREGHLPSGTRWKLANAHYYNGNLAGAAAALAQLADEAGRVGDLEVRSEERRVGKECRAGWWAEHEKKKEGEREWRVSVRRGR